MDIKTTFDFLKKNASIEWLTICSLDDVAEIQNFNLELTNFITRNLALLELLLELICDSSAALLAIARGLASNQRLHHLRIEMFESKEFQTERI